MTRLESRYHDDVDVEPHHCKDKVVRVVTKSQLEEMYGDVFGNFSDETCERLPSFCHGVRSCLYHLGIDVATLKALMTDGNVIFPDSLAVTDCRLEAASNYLARMQTTLVTAGWSQQSNVADGSHFVFKGSNPSHWQALLHQWHGAYFVLERFGLLKK